MKGFTIAIIGGKGAMGSAFARLFRKAGAHVLIADLGTKLTPEVVCKQADITVFSVPITSAPALIKKVAPFAKPRSLLVDVTSIKSPVMNAFEKAAPASCEVLGLHPLFGPSMVSNMKGQVIAVCPQKKGSMARILLEFLKKHGAILRSTTPRKHDELMAIVQGITHFSSLASGLALQKLHASIKKTREFSSPIYELRLAMIGRILHQSPRLYAEIEIENPASLKALQAYKEAIDELYTTVASKDAAAFCALFSQAATYFGSYKKEAYALTDELLRTMTYPKKRL